MSHKDAALSAITGQFLALRSDEDGDEALLGIDLAAILAQLLDGLINKCFPGTSDTAVAESMVDPTPSQDRAFAKACQRQANKEIKRRPDRNPAGRKLTIRERNSMRDELANDLYLAMRSTAETKGVEGCEQLVAEMRR